MQTSIFHLPTNNIDVRVVFSSTEIFSIEVEVADGRFVDLDAWACDEDDAQAVHEEVDSRLPA